MGLIDRVASAWNARYRSEWPTITWQQYAELLNFNGNTYLTGGLNQTISGNVEEIDASFAGLVQGAYKSNGIVFACMLARMRVFRQARFQYQELREGKPGKLYGRPSLDILEHPWANAGTGDLLARAITDADLAGNSFWTRRNGQLRRLRPDWVTIALGSPNDPQVEAGDIDAEVIGYIYHPGGRTSSRPPEGLLPNEVAHFAPIPDPTASFRGMSWLTPIVREIAADKQMTEHKSLYLANGGTPNMVVSLDKDMKAAASPAAFSEWIEAFKKQNPTSGFEKFKTMYLAGGTSMEVVGSTLQQIDFKSVQGAGETRIAAAAGVPPVIVGLSEGLAAATYSNYGQARRAFADNTLRDLWQDISVSLETLVPAPSGSRLWYDDRYIQALAEDKKDLAEVRNLEAQQVRTLTDAGFTPESVIEAVTTGDFNRLTHTGLYSVQLQPPGTLKAPVPAEPVAQIPATIPKREEMLLEVMRSIAARPVNVTVDAPITVEPTNVTIAEGAFQTAPAEVRFEENSVRVVEHVPMMTVLDRDADGRVIGHHEEPLPAVEAS